MIYEHQQIAIDYITEKFRAMPEVEALFISGSIAHGFNEIYSDVDINIVVSNEIYDEKVRTMDFTYYEDASMFYEGGYFDGKFITWDYLDMVAERGNEPTRFALHDSTIAFDKVGRAKECLERLSAYSDERAKENSIRFLAQLDGWEWYCGEALRKGNKYLLDMAVSKLILFAGRLILLENRLFFPYHKWFMRVLETAPAKPEGLMDAINGLLADKSAANIKRLYSLVKTYRDWTLGAEYSWTSIFVHDVETVWMREDEMIDNL